MPLEYKTVDTRNPAVYYQRQPQDTAELIQSLFTELKSKSETFANNTQLKSIIANHLSANEIKWLAALTPTSAFNFVVLFNPNTKRTGTPKQREILNKLKLICQDKHVQGLFNSIEFSKFKVLANHIAETIQRIDRGKINGKSPNPPWRAWRGGYGRRSKIVTRRVGKVKTSVSMNWLRKKRATRRKKRQVGGAAIAAAALLVVLGPVGWAVLGGLILIGICVFAYAYYDALEKDKAEREENAAREENEAREKKEKECKNAQKEFDAKFKKTLKGIDKDLTAERRDKYLEIINNRDDHELNEYEWINKTNGKTYKISKSMQDKFTKIRDDQDTIINEMTLEHSKSSETLYTECMNPTTNTNINS